MKEAHHKAHLKGLLRQARVNGHDWHLSSQKSCRQINRRALSCAVHQPSRVVSPIAPHCWASRTYSCHHHAGVVPTVCCAPLHQQLACGAIPLSTNTRHMLAGLPNQSKRTDQQHHILAIGEAADAPLLVTRTELSPFPSKHDCSFNKPAATAAITDWCTASATATHQSH